MTDITFTDEVVVKFGEGLVRCIPSEPASSAFTTFLFIVLWADGLERAKKALRLIAFLLCDDQGDCDKLIAEVTVALCNARDRLSKSSSRNH